LSALGVEVINSAKHLLAIFAPQPYHFKAELFARFGSGLLLINEPRLLRLFNDKANFHLVFLGLY